MTFEYDDKGKFFTDVIVKESLAVMIQTSAGLIRGDIYIREGVRLKDKLETEEVFIALTDAEVVAASGEVLFTKDFIAVHKEQIIWISPLEEGGKHE